MKTPLTFLLFLASVQCEIISKSVMTLEDNGYRGVLIALSDEIPQNWDIVDNLKDHFTLGSAALYRATKYRAYFQNITILVPQSWDITARSDVTSALGESFQIANIIVAPPNPTYGNRPYVLARKGCGEEGVHMHLTPEYVLNITEQTPYGPVGSLIVHEWGHLRYGLFDEYHVPSQPGSHKFYLENGKISATRCGINLEGGLWGSCMPESQATLPPDNGGCYFFGVPSLNGQTASVMFRQFYPEVVDFCDNDASDPATLHNRAAPNQQNILCEGASAWEVMRRHTDFANGANPPRLDLTTVPTFSIVQARSVRIVLVLDTSGSMGESLHGSNFTRMQKLRQDSSKFIETKIPDGAHVGIVTFSSGAVVGHNMAEVNTVTKKSLISALPSEASGGTCIGCGIVRGIQLLESVGDPAGGIIIIISDGDENESPTIADVTPEAVTKSVVVSSLLYSSAAAAALVTLASDTGGSSYFSSADASDTDLFKYLETAIGDISSKSTVDRVSVTLQSLTIPPDVNASFVIDDTLGMRTVVSFLYQTDTPDFSVALVAPSGVTYLSSDSSVTTENDQSHSLDMEIPGRAETGRWLVRLTSLYPQVLHLYVSSGPASVHSTTFRVEGSISHHKVNYTDAASRRLVLVGGVTNGYAPVLNASVTAEVTYNNVIVTKTLQDTGLGADVAANDGFYSAYFLDVEGNGNYRVTVMAAADDKQAYYVKTVLNNAASKADFVNPGVTQSFESVYFGPFARYSSAGFFVVDGFSTSDASQDVLPPAKIVDLDVTSADPVTNHVTLTWTAVGDDFDQGTASSYELRYCSSIDEGLSAFGQCPLITAVNISEPFSPSPASTREQYTWRATGSLRDRTLVLGIKACDDVNQCSPLSNLVATIIRDEPVFQFEVVGPDVTTEATSGTPTSDASDPVSYSLIAAVVASVVVVSLSLL